MLILATLLTLSSPAPPSPAPSLEIRLVPSGDLIAEETNDEVRPLFLRWSVVLEDKAGIEWKLTELRYLVLEDGARDDWGIPPFGEDDIVSRAGKCTISPKGQLTIPLKLYFEGPRRHLSLAVTVDAKRPDGTFAVVTTPRASVR